MRICGAYELQLIALYLLGYIDNCKYLQTVKGVKAYNAAIAATNDGLTSQREGEKQKMHTHSYCCLDYAQANYIQTFAFLDAIFNSGNICSHCTVDCTGV